MDRRRSLKLLLAAVLTVLFGGLAAGSRAHAQDTTVDDTIRVTSTKPTDGAELTATPSQLVLRFAQPLPEVQAVVQLQNEDRELQNTGQPIAFDRRQGLRVNVLEELPAGTYTFTWLIRPVAGEQVSGKLSFTLSAPATTTTLAEGAVSVEDADTSGLGLKKSSHYTGLLGTVGRTMGYLGIAALAGALILIALVWAEGVEYVLTVRHLWLAWIVGAVGMLLSIACLTADVKGVSVAKGFMPTEWGDLLDSTPGKAIVIRVLAMLGCAWVAARPERVVDSGTQLMALGIPAITLATYGWSRSTEGSSLLLVPVGIVHVFAVAAWFGGAALLYRVVLAGPGDADLVQATRGFRRIAVPALGLSIISGGVQTAENLGGTGNLFSSSYGKIFVLKVLAVIAMAFVATANRAFVRQRLQRSAHLDARPAARLRRSVRTEVATGALVLLLTGWLAGTATPGSAASDPATSNKNSFVSSDGAFKADITFGPKRVGQRVEFHFRLKSPKNADDIVVTFQPADGKTDGYEVPVRALPNYGFEAKQGFVFGSSGTWIVTITGNGPNGPLPTITREFTVANQDGSVPEPTSTTTPVPTTRQKAPADTDTDTDTGA